ncbi:DUF4153 domain-containing protein [Xanthobacter sp. AM11]|uniref:DUF4153 domain-containing protein n=1 Tax=Xanthobacter sp. AM11 TaxID=3380643 RepID=UPI0039BF915A
MSVLWRGVPALLLRFPVPLLIMAAALAAFFLDPAGMPAWLRTSAPALPGARAMLRWDAILSPAATCFLAATAAVLFAEGQGWRGWARHALAVVAGGLAGLVLAFPQVTQPSAPLLTVAAFCAVLLAPFGLGRGDAAGFWWHAARVTGGAGTALLGAVLLSIGAMLVEGAVRVLFLRGTLGLIPPLSGDYAVPVAFALVAPLLWLSRLPLPGEAAPAALAPVRAPLTVARFVAVPLLLVYGALLVAYAARIAWLGVVPAGQIGRYVPAFGVAGTLVFMMLQGERGQGRRLGDLFCAVWFPLLVVPLALLGAALWLRIEPFGFTVQRGHLLLVAAWLVLITLLFAPRLGRGDLRLIPGVLLVLSLASAAGPFGLPALANRDQAQRLVDLLAAQGLVKAGRLVPDAPGKLDMKQTAQAQSIVRYLGRSHGLGTLAPLFAGREDDPFAKGRTPAQADIEMRISGFPRDAGRAVAAPDPVLTLSVKSGPALIAAAGAVRVLGPFQIGFGRRQSVTTVDGITTAVADNVVEVDAADGRRARLDLAAAIQAQEKAAVGRPPRLDAPVRIVAPFGAEQVTVVLQGTTLSVSRAATTVRGGSYFLVLGPAS